MKRTLQVRLAQAWFRLSRPMTLGVRVVALDEAGRVCLVRHSYTPGWHLPGGGVERGERAVDAATKELQEEAGLLTTAAHLQLVSVHANHANFPNDHVLLFRCAAFVRSHQTPNPREIVETGFFSLDALPDGATAGTRARLRELAGEPVNPDWTPR